METQIRAKQATPTYRKGPIEGIVIVNGHPQTEAADMPSISFESIEAIKRLNTVAE